MTGRRIVYVAAPFAAPTAAEVARNIARARAVGRLAVHRGLAPIVPHVLGAAGLFGAPTDDGSSSPTRTAALECSLALVRRADDLWAICRDDGSLSEGTRAERLAWHSDCRDGVYTCARWDLWREWIEDTGLGAYLGGT